VLFRSESYFVVNMSTTVSKDNLIQGIIINSTSDFHVYLECKALVRPDTCGIYNNGKWYTAPTSTGHFSFALPRCDWRNVVFDLSVSSPTGPPLFQMEFKTGDSWYHMLGRIGIPQQRRPLGMNEFFVLFILVITTYGAIFTIIGLLKQWRANNEENMFMEQLLDTDEFDFSHRIKNTEEMTIPAIKN